jgi:hypothetical protein
MGILDLPSEIIEIALVHSHPRDVAAMAKSCKAFHALIYQASDSHLWRHLWFAQGFEDPRLAEHYIPLIDADHFDWRMELQRRTWAELVALTDYNGAAIEHRVETLKILVKAVDTVPPPSRSPGTLYTHQWVENLISVAGLRIRPSVYLGDDQEIQDGATIYKSSDTLESEETRLRHQLHVYLGLSDYERTAEVASRNRTEARCFVYDLRNCAADNNYAPTIPGKGDVINWRYMDHMYEVLIRNVEDRAAMWQGNWPFPEFILKNARPYAAPGTWRRRKQDWAGVEGKWQRAVCFMDYL